MTSDDSPSLPPRRSPQPIPAAATSRPGRGEAATAAQLQSVADALRTKEPGRGTAGSSDHPVEEPRSAEAPAQGRRTTLADAGDATAAAPADGAARAAEPDPAQPARRSTAVAAGPGIDRATLSQANADATPPPGSGGAPPPGDTGGGTPDTTPPPPVGGEPAPGRRGRKIAIIGASVVAILAVAYGVAYAVTGDSLARGATVAGVEVGGMTPEEAEAALTAELPSLVDTPINVTVDGDENTYELVPSASGLTIDVPATIDDVPGGNANPLSLVRALIGSGEIAPVASVDRAALEAAVTAIAAQSDTEAVNGSVAFDGGSVVTSEPVVGRAVDIPAAADALEAAFYGEGEAPGSAVTVPAAEAPPAVDADEVARAVAEFAEPAMSAPVTVVAGDKSVAIEPGVLGQALALAPDESGVLQPALDGAKLIAAAEEELAAIGQEGKDATIQIENGAPTVVPGEKGMGIGAEALSAAVLPALVESGDAREAPIELTEVDPKLTTEGAEALGVKEVVGTFTTVFPHAEYRNVNIGTAAERIDNTLILPGEEFSLNGIVGERTEANGFVAGTIINGGRLEESMGGGVSQVATTTFHAAFKAGLEDTEHWPHSIYFDRYPIGQEATVAWGAKDMRFTNDTPYGVVVDTSFTPSGSGEGELTVRIWSTEHFRTETSVSERYDFTSPQTIYDSSSDCSAQGGSQGFSINSYRKVWTLDGTLVKDENDPWTYNPNHKVICGKEPGDDD